MADHEPLPTTPPTLFDRLWTIVRFPVGAALMAAWHVATVPSMTRRTVNGTARDLPPELPPDLVDERIKQLGAGHGPLYHRTFAVTIAGADVDAAGLLERLVADLDRPAPFGVITFRKILGDLGRLERGDEYRVRMPAPWDGPVRVVDRDARSFRFATLSRHLEAGQIEFRAVDDTDGRLRFEIEAWSAAGDPLARLLYVDLALGREVQLGLWVQFCLGMVRLSGGRREGAVGVTTRRLDRRTTRRHASSRH